MKKKIRCTATKGKGKFANLSGTCSSCHHPRALWLCLLQKLVFPFKMHQKYNQVLRRGCSSSHITGTSAEGLGGWAQGSSKVWFRKCSMLRACLTVSGTQHHHHQGHRVCRHARSTTAHPTPSPDLNRAEIKHYLPSMCLTSSLQEPAGK